MNLNLESNIIDASMESLVPRLESSESGIRPGERILQHLEEDKEAIKDDTIMLPFRLEESDFKGGSHKELRNLRGKTGKHMPDVSSIIKESDIDSVESKIENLWHHLPKDKKKR